MIEQTSVVFTAVQPKTAPLDVGSSFQRFVVQPTVGCFVFPPEEGIFVVLLKSLSPGEKRSTPRGSLYTFRNYPRGSTHGIARWAPGAPHIHAPHKAPTDRVSPECRERREHDKEKRCKHICCRCDARNDAPNSYSEYPNRVRVPLEQKEYDGLIFLLEHVE